MKRVFAIGCAAVLAGVLFTASAQNQKDKTRKRPPAPPPVPVYLGNSGISEGPVTKTQFDALILTGLTSRDTSGTPAKVEGFTFTYVERSIYEDSVGNLIPVTDYLTEYCAGDTLSPAIKAGLSDRTKAGDTVIIDRIKVRLSDGGNRWGKTMRLVLTR